MAYSNIEHLPGIRIEAESTRLEREAQRLQAEWFAAPTLTNQYQFAQALKYWAKETKNKTALAHALKLLEATP